MLHVAAWSTPAGVFFVTGEVANYGLTTDQRRAGGGRSADGGRLERHRSGRSGDGLRHPAGRIRALQPAFRRGQPSLATTYQLTLGRRDWQPDAESPTIYGQNEMTWTDRI